MARKLVEMSPETPSFHAHLGAALIVAGDRKAEGRLRIMDCVYDGFVT